MIDDGAHRGPLGSQAYGVQYGIVAQNKDPDGLDRVKIRLAWLDHGDQDQTHWAQLLAPMAGKEFGWYTLPDIDDVVAVMFVGGDINQPVIVGGVWSKTDYAPETNEDGKNNFRGYRSRSGSRLIFDDSAQVKVVFADKTTKNMLGVGSFSAGGAGPNVTAIYQPPMSAGSGVALSSMEGTVEINCKGGTLKIDSQQSIKISAKTTIDIKAGGDLSVEGASAAKLTSSDNSNYDAPKVDIA